MMELAKNVFECGTLDNVKRVKGHETDCIWGTFHTRTADIHITYDCRDGVLVIHEWYNLLELERSKVMDVLKRYFKSCC